MPRIPGPASTLTGYRWWPLAGAGEPRADFLRTRCGLAAPGHVGSHPWRNLGHALVDEDVQRQLLFQIITEREEKASIAIGTNVPFSEWGPVFPDPRLVAAIAGRVTFNAHILETGTQSYRLRISKTSGRRNRAS